jgi:23S rRNA pseudouridine2605 synthase
MRLAKYIAVCGVASRRRAEELVAAGRVRVDGERVLDPARDIDERTSVTVDRRPISPEPHEHYMLNKPVGVVSTARDPQGRPKVTDLVRSTARLYPVGRLDADTSGLILLTNDGGLANRLMHPSFEVEKAYRARIEGSVDERALRSLRTGVTLREGRSLPARVRVIRRTGSTTVLELVLHEGRKRQVRRMCEAIGHPVIELERTRYGPLRLGRLASGSARRLTRVEVEQLEGAGTEMSESSGGRPQ